MRVGPLLGLTGAALALQGCVALAIPAVAAGVIGKKEIDKARDRARAAEASFDSAQPVPQVIVGNPPLDTAAIPPGLPAQSAAVEVEEAQVSQPVPTPLSLANINNAYLPFARYVIAEADKRGRGELARGTVLVQSVSLSQPQTMECGTKPFAAIIDLDVAPGTPAEMEVERQNGFSTLLEAMRNGGIRIAWLAETGEARLKPILDLLKEGDAPIIRDADLMLVGLPGKYRKQERRWQLAANYCVLAIAGDRKGDFDELYDYLRDPNYAIRLEAFMGKGWFELPHPVAAIDSERLEIQSEKKAEQ